MDTRELLDKIGENLSVRRSFGAAYERDGLLLIPVALVAGGGGGGEGSIQPRATSAVETAEPARGTPPEGQPPTGSGGGFGGLVLPLGVYEIKADQVRWVPAYDVTLIVFASLSVLRVLMALLRHGRRRHRV